MQSLKFIVILIEFVFNKLNQFYFIVKLLKSETHKNNEEKDLNCQDNIKFTVTGLLEIPFHCVLCFLCLSLNST